MSTPPIIDEIYPISVAEALCEACEWEFDRVADDQITMAIEGQWRTYSITLAWSAYDSTLRLVCTCEMESPSESLPELYALLNKVNDSCFTGTFTFWAEQKLMVYRYGLLLMGEHTTVSPEQVDTMIRQAVAHCERYYPAFQLATWGKRSAADSLGVAISEGYGRA